MKDKEIIQLYLARNEQAIRETAEKYGRYCTRIANNILGDREDVEECVNDTFLSVWEHIPPDHPDVLKLFVGRIARNFAITRSRQKTTQKRGGGELPLVLDELAECVSGADDPEDLMIAKQLRDEINGFLDSLPVQKRQIFVGRYWYLDSVTTIADKLGLAEGNVSVILHRLRKELKQYLNNRGYHI